jgi:hypothetical protein
VAVAPSQQAASLAGAGESATADSTPVRPIGSGRSTAEPARPIGSGRSTAEPARPVGSARSTAEPVRPPPRYDLPRPSRQPLDPTVATAAGRLVTALAPFLGLDPDPIHVELTPGTAGGSAALIGGVPVIRIGTGPSDAVPDRALIVHELAHVAQHANRERGLADPDTTAAEAEAAALAAAARRGLRLWAPRAALPAGRRAADTDARWVSPQPAEPSAALMAAELTDLVRTTRAGELRRITDALGSIWAVTGEVIETTLQVLETVDFATGRAMLQTLAPESRIRLGHLHDEHHQRHPLAAATVIASLASAEIAQLGQVEPQGRDPLGAALHGLNLSGAPRPVLRGALAALRRVPKPTLIRLMRGDRRDAFRDLLATVPPPGTDADDIREAWQRETRVASVALEEASRHLVDDLRTRHLSGAAFAHAALDALRPLAVAVPPEPAASPTPDVAAAPASAGSAPAPAPAAPAPAAPAHAPAAPAPAPPAAATNAPPTPSERLRVAVIALDAAGMIDPILDGLPESERYSETTHYGQTLRAALATRAPALTLPRIESLLSYGLFDWAIRDYEALFAYFLVRTLPLAEQDAWRVRDDGQWFQRLEDNLPPDFRAGPFYTGVGSEFTAGIPGGRVDDASAVDLELSVVRNKWHEQRGANTAIWITRTLIGLDPASGQLPRETPPPVAVRTVAVRRLDTGELDQLWDAFPDDYIYDQPGRGELLDLNTMRDPVHVAQRASSLLSTGLFDWWVSSREAWIAYQLVRALSPEEQERFQHGHADKWSSMMSAMTPKQRASTAVTPLSGRGPWPSRDQLRERLRDDRLWNAEHAAQLRALIDILRASDDDAFVFEESSRHTRAGLKQLITDLGLYDPDADPPRKTYTPQRIRGQGVGTDILDFAGFGVRGALVLIGSLFVVNILGRSVTANDYNLNWLQWAMGGDLDGVQLADGDRPTGPPPGGRRAAQMAAQRDEDDWPGEEVHTNRLSFQADLNNGVVHLSLPELLLDHVNFVRAGSSYRTGRVRLAGLDVTASFSDRHYRTPVGVEADAAEIGVDDMVVANATVGALALAHLFLRALHLRSGATGAEEIGGLEPDTGVTPIPLLGPLWDALTNVIAIRGSVPFAPSLVDLMLMPVTAGMSFWESEAVGLAANAAVPSPHPVDYLWGLATDGTLRPPRTVTDRATDAMRMLRSVDLRFSELTIEGLSLGAGVETASVTIHDLAIGAARSRPAYLRQLITSLELALGRAAGVDRDPIESRLRQAREELHGTPALPGGLEALETELEGLERRDRWIAGSLSPAESQRMAELSDRLRRDTGVVVDVGSIEVGEISGAVQAAGARITGIHLDGHVPIDTGGGYYSDEELTSRFLGRTQASKATIPADAHLSIASTELLPGAGGAPILRIAADRVPTTDEIRERLNKIAPGANPELRARLQDVVPLLGELETLRSHASPTPDQQERITALTNTVRDRLGITVGSLSLGPITGGLDASGALTATVPGIDAQDIVGDGYSVRHVTGDLTLGAAGAAQLAANYPTVGSDVTRERALALQAHFGLNATIEHAETETGNAVERATLDIRGDVSAIADGLALSNVWLGRLVLDGVNIGARGTGMYVHADNVTAEGVSTDGAIHFAGTGDQRHFASLVLTNLKIDRLSGQNLTYESTDAQAGRKLHVDAPSGTLGGVLIQNFTLGRDSAGGRTIDASARIDALEVVGYTAIRTALSDGSTKTVTGDLRGGAMPDIRTEPPPRATPGTSPTTPQPVDGAPSGGPPSTVTARYVSNDAGSTISLNPHDLDLLGTEIVMPPGRSIVITQARVSTAPGATTGIELTDTATTVDLTLDNVALGRVRWRSGSVLVTSNGGATARTAHVSLSLQSGDPHATDPAQRLDHLYVGDVDIQDLDASQLRIYRPPFQVDLGTFGPHPGALHAGRVHLQNLTLPFAADGSPGSPTAGHLEITGTHTDLRALIADGLAARRTAPGDISAAGELDVGSITVDIFEGSHYIARFSGASASLGASTEGLVVAGGLSNVSGTLDITPDRVSVQGLRVPSATVDSLILSTTVKGHPLTLETEEGGAVYLTDVTANAHFDLWREGETHPSDAWCRRFVIDQMEIQRLDTEGLRLELPADGVVIRAPAQPYSGSGPLPPLTTLRHVTVAEPGGPFEWRPGAAGFMRGRPRIEELTVPRLEADVAGKFHGAVELHSGEISLGVLERGGFTVDAAHPRARMTDPTAPASLDRPDRTIFIEELGAESLHYSGGAVKVDEAHIDRLTFEQPGVHIDVRRISTPGTVTVRTGPWTGTIPELRIDDAHIHLDFTAMAPGSGGRPIDQASIESLVDNLQGTAALSASVDVTPPIGSPYNVSRPLAVTVVDGHVVTAPGGTAGGWLVLDRVAHEFVLSIVLPLYGAAELTRFSLLPSPPGPPPTSSVVDLRTLDLSSIAIDLSAISPRPIPLTLVGNPSGTLTLAPTALVSFTASGHLHPFAAGVPVGHGSLRMAMSRLNIASSNFSYSGVGVTTLRIEISDMHDGVIDFDGTTPLRLDATITSGVAHDINWKLPP